jgi:ElaB/YqjD/DUF883 family membrane-anchored ribosome-binding protein
MSEKLKPTVEELQKEIENLKEMLEERIKRRPLEAAGIIFAGGLILGLFIGIAISKRG